jgi:hypothetical protein
MLRKDLNDGKESLMNDDRRRTRQQIMRCILNGMTPEGERLVITEDGELHTWDPNAPLEVLLPTDFASLVALRQREYEAALRLREVDYPTRADFEAQIRREDEAMYRTLDYVADRLQVSYLVGGNEDLEQVIYETVLRLPDDVRTFACDTVVFLSSPYGHSFRGVDWADKWLIILPPDLPDADATGVVAHQIAHAWRGHGEAHHGYGYTAQEEREACVLARAWGFSGRGAHFTPLGGKPGVVVSYLY